MVSCRRALTFERYSTKKSEVMSSNGSEVQTIAVAGASGFLGRALSETLGSDYELIGLTRDLARSRELDQGYQWRKADLFSRKQTLDGLEGADLAIYLAHSGRPSASLTQGDVRDMELICADNFARAARRQGVNEIVHISGIVPDEGEPGHHLSTRLEVEETLGVYGAQVTTLRVGMVIGPGGDLTEMLFRLVEKLPVMVLPRWTQNEIRPISRSDLMELVQYVLQNPVSRGRSWVVGGPDPVTFEMLLQMSAELMELRRRIYTVSVTTPRLSSAWISMFTGLPRTMVRPVVEMLRHPTLRGGKTLQEHAGQTPTALRSALAHALDHRELPDAKTARNTDSSREMIPIKTRREVRSVQRLPVPPGRRARWIAETYARWLPRFMAPFMRVEFREERYLDFYARLLPWPILSLELDREVSQPDRQLYWIQGGLLAGTQDRGRLEFRDVLAGQWSLAAIHRFRPRLPWFIYILTQAQVHLFVMKAFGRYLGRERQRCLESDDRKSLPGPEPMDDIKSTG